MTHAHEVARETGPYPYSGPVARDENRAAHGNVRFEGHCSCGHVRSRLVNGRHEEVGLWRESPEHRAGLARARAAAEERRREREREMAFELEVAAERRVRS